MPSPSYSINFNLLQNAKQPVHWKDAAPFPPEGTLTFSRQKQLPKLPIPAFERTIEKLIQSLQPLAWSSDEWKSTKAKIDQFARPGGLGPILHRRLLERNETDNIKHWLEEFWDNAAYLKYRDSVLVNVSYYYGFSLPYPERSLAYRTAALIRSVLLQRRQLKQGSMPIDLTRKDPLCMDTWRWMFDCCRIPGLEGTDWSVTGAQSGDDGNHGHIIVLRRNRPWKVDISIDGTLLSTQDLETQLRHIYESPLKTAPSIGLLTSNDRDTWAKDYANLLSTDSRNAVTLQDIVTAAFVVCLDTSTPETRLESSKNLFHGGDHLDQLGNRWLDKPAQIIICDNGESGYMGEHSVMDGTPSVTMIDRALGTLYHGDFDHGSQTDLTVSPPRPLEWVVTPEVATAILGAQKAAERLVSRQAMGMLTTAYGRDEIKKFGFSPDAWAQMIIQLAYHRLLACTGGSGRKRNGGTYEAASTRGFFKGRTETIRIVTEEAMAFCDAMDDPSQDAETRRSLLKTATTKHRLDADDAVNAMGIDRHLFGMRNVIGPGESLPALFSDPLYIRGSTWVLSTSAIFSRYFTRGYGWGQVVPGGFGVAYMTGFPDRLEFTVTSRKSQPNADFVQQIDVASEDMRRLFEGATKAHM
ncbi:Carnitine O-acetyltransferase mitochondrial [Tulasnella sp. 403]|nr:Carnitine O-acetyltransferase mitochondrial [Tulasnella sp. 403]